MNKDTVTLPSFTLKNLVVLGALLLAAGLRFYRLAGQSFWNDEGNSARIAERSLPLILEGAAGDIHPPGYYLALAAWRGAAGHSEFALRGFSALGGIILVALIYRLGKQYFDEPAARGAAFFAAIHPALIYYSQEARMYEWAAVWGAGLFVMGDRALKLEIRDWRRTTALALLIAAGLYTHYSFGFIIISFNLILAIRLAQLLITNHHASRPISVSLISSLYLPQLLALLLFAPWLPTAIRQLTTWPASREYLSLGQAFGDAVRWLTLGPTSDGALDQPMLFGLATLVALSLWRRRKLEPIAWLFVPTLMTVAFGLFSATFAKFLIVAAPALCLLAGNGVAAIRDGRRGREQMTRREQVISYLKPYVFLPIWLPTLALPLGIALNQLYFDPAYARADYRGIARYLDSIAKPRDAILLNAPNQWETFTYYHPDLSNVFPVARSRPLNEPEQIAELEQIAREHDRLFVVYWGEAQSDPNRLIETWLNEHTFKAYDQWYRDVRLAAYAVPRAAAELQTRSDTAFGGRIVLDGYSLNNTTFAPGDILQLTLFWHADSPITARYKVFVHLIRDPAQPPVAQHDGEPGGGLALTTTWQPGQTIADNHGVYLPLGLPPGEYTLSIGLYSVDDGARLAHPDGDALALATVTVK